MNGNELIAVLVAATGLPQEIVRRDLDSALTKAGFDIDTITLPQLRVFFAEYMQEILVSAKRSYPA